MKKQFIRTKEEYINTLWGDNGSFNFDGIEFSKENDTYTFGIEFIGKYDLTNNDDDDGEYAGIEFYNIIEDNFPVKFPVMVVIYEGFCTKYITEDAITYIYPEDLI